MRSLIQLRERTFGQMVGEARKRSNVTQQHLAKALGYKSPQFISNWERGLSEPPHQALSRLPFLLDLQVSEILSTASTYYRLKGELELIELEATIKPEPKVGL